MAGILGFSSLGQTFWDGGPSYNFWNLVVAVLGLVLGVIGLLVGIWQLVKTRHAAEAARDAAVSASIQMANVAAVVSIAKLAQLATQLVLLLRSNDAASAAQRGLDLREGAATARFATGTARLLSPYDWQSLMSRIGRLQETLEMAARRDDPDAAELARCIIQASGIIEILSGMVGPATNAAGAAYGNS